MALRRLAAAESPFRRLRFATFDTLKGASKADGSPLAGARDCPLRRIGVSHSALSRVGGCDSTLRRLGAVAGSSWTKQQMEAVLDSPRNTRWLSSLPGGIKPGSAGGGDEKAGSAGSGDEKAGSAGGSDEKPGSAGGGDEKPGSASSGGGGEDRRTFDWDNFDWIKFKEYFKIAEILPCIYFALGLSACGSAVMFVVYYYVRKEVQSQVSVEREKREVFGKNATIAHHEFVLRTNLRYDSLQAQFNELREKNMELQQLLFDSRNLTVALMGQLNDLQKESDVQAKGCPSEAKEDGNQSLPLEVLTQFNELREKNKELQQLLFDSRNLTDALMGQLNDLQKENDVQAKGSPSEAKEDDNQSLPLEAGVPAKCSPSELKADGNQSSSHEGGVPAKCSSSDLKQDGNLSGSQEGSSSK